MDSYETNYNKIPEEDTISFSPIIFQLDKTDYKVDFFHDNIKGDAFISFKHNCIEIKYKFNGIYYKDTINCNISFCNQSSNSFTNIYLKGFNKIDTKLKKGFEYQDKNQYPFYLNILCTFIPDRNLKICHIYKRIPELKPIDKIIKPSDKNLDKYDRIKSPKRKRSLRKFYTDDGGPASKASLEFPKKIKT